MNVRKMTIEDIVALPLPKKIGVGIGVFFAVLLIGFILLLHPRQKKLWQAEQLEEQLSQQLGTKLESINGLQTQQDLFYKAKALLNQLNKSLPTPEDMPEILDHITKLGEKLNLNLTLVKPLAETDDGMFRKIPVEIQTSGSYQEMATFLSQLAQINYKINFAELTLTTIDSKIPENALNLSLVIEIYFQFQGKIAPWDITDAKK